MDKLDSLYKFINYTFHNSKIVCQALNKNNISFERLEFLGDRILNFIISEYLYNNFPDMSEGKLSRKLSTCINKYSIVLIARKISLDSFMKYRKESIIRHNDGILCDGMEALIGAIYIDCKDINIIQNIIINLWSEILNQKYTLDSKTELQEILHKLNMNIPEYIIDNITGEKHNPLFHMSLKISDQIFTAYGRSKKSTEQKLAAQAIKYLRCKN